jgi:hypothetical protein
MIAAFILVLSAAMLLQFAVSTWRSMWLTVADRELSDCLQTATGIAPDGVGADDFDLLARTTRSLSAVSAEGGSWLAEVKMYYLFVKMIRKGCAVALPGLSNWAKNELVACSRYAAAVLDQRLNANLAHAAQQN